MPWKIEGTEGARKRSLAVGAVDESCSHGASPEGWTVCGLSNTRVLPRDLTSVWRFSKTGALHWSPPAVSRASPEPRGARAPQVLGIVGGIGLAMNALRLFEIHRECAALKKRAGVDRVRTRSILVPLMGSLEASSGGAGGTPGGPGWSRNTMVFALWRASLGWPLGVSGPGEASTPGDVPANIMPQLCGTFMSSAWLLCDVAADPTAS